MFRSVLQLQVLWGERCLKLHQAAGSLQVLLEAALELRWSLIAELINSWRLLLAQGELCALLGGNSSCSPEQSSQAVSKSLLLGK